MPALLYIRRDADRRCRASVHSIHTDMLHHLWGAVTALVGSRVDRVVGTAPHLRPPRLARCRDREAEPFTLAHDSGRCRVVARRVERAGALLAAIIALIAVAIDLVERAILHWASLRHDLVLLAAQVYDGVSA